ncbi:MAG: PAS domain S-box protein [Bryobacteraceae bacterium]
MDATLRHMSWNPKGSWELSLRNKGYKLNAAVAGLENSPPALVPGSVISIQGVPGCLFNKRRQLSGINLQVPSYKYLAVRSLAGSIDNVPLLPLDHVLRFEPSSEVSERVRIEGTVTRASRSGTLYLQSATGGIRVEAGPETRLEVGNHVTAIGFPAFGGYSPVLENATVLAVRPGQPLAPTAVSFDEAMSGKYDSQLIRTTASILWANSSPGKLHLGLVAGTSRFTVEIDDPDQVPEDLNGGALVEVSGVCVIKRSDRENKPLGLSILVRKLQDVRILSPAPWWTAGRTVQAVWGFAAIAGLVAIWIFVLRRKLKSQTAIIIRQLEAETSLEQRYRDLFENANDAIFTFDLNGKFLSINEAGERIFGYRRKELYEYSIPEMFKEGHAVLEEITSSLQSGQRSALYQGIVLSASGQKIHLKSIADAGLGKFNRCYRDDRTGYYGAKES